MEPRETVTTWGNAVMSSVREALALFLTGIPKVIAFLAILALGWLIAGAISKIVAALLRRLHFNDLIERAGITGMMRSMGVTRDPAGVLSDAVMWLVRIVFLMAACDVADLTVVSRLLERFMAWIPQLVTAVIILVLGGLLANVVSRLVRGAAAESGMSSPDLLAGIAKFGIVAAALIMAVNQVGIDPTLFNTLYMGFVAAVSLAAGLAFGLGARETAGQMVRDWYSQYQQAAPRIAQAVESARSGPETPGGPSASVAAPGQTPPPTF